MLHVLILMAVSVHVLGSLWLLGSTVLLLLGLRTLAKLAHKIQQDSAE